MKFRGKRFISDSHEEYGSVGWYLNTDGRMGLYTMDGELRLGDCSEVIILDFSCYHSSDVPKRISKLDSLIEELQNMRDKMAFIDEELSKSKKFYY
jgi:hypothetical protein